MIYGADRCVAHSDSTWGSSRTFLPLALLLSCLHWQPSYKAQNVQKIIEENICCTSPTLILFSESYKVYKACGESGQICVRPVGRLWKPRLNDFTCDLWKHVRLITTKCYAGRRSFCIYWFVFMRRCSDVCCLLFSPPLCFHLQKKKKKSQLSLPEKSKKQLDHNVGFGGFGESWVHPQNFKLVCQISKERRKKARVSAGFKYSFLMTRSGPRQTDRDSFEDISLEFVWSGTLAQLCASRWGVSSVCPVGLPEVSALYSFLKRHPDVRPLLCSASDSPL